MLDQGNEYWKGTPVGMDSSVERASSPVKVDRTAKMAVPPGDGNSSDSASLHYDAAAMTRRLDSRRSLWFGCDSALAFGSRLNGSSPLPPRPLVAALHFVPRRLEPCTGNRHKDAVGFTDHHAGRRI